MYAYHIDRHLYMTFTYTYTYTFTFTYNTDMYVSTAYGISTCVSRELQ